MPDTSQLRHFCKAPFTRAVLGSGRSGQRAFTDVYSDRRQRRAFPGGWALPLWPGCLPPCPSLARRISALRTSPVPSQDACENHSPFHLLCTCFDTVFLSPQAWAPGGGVEGGRRAGPTFQTTRSHLCFPNGVKLACELCSPSLRKRSALTSKSVSVFFLLSTSALTFCDS